jgi:hypothetical protein
MLCAGSAAFAVTAGLMARLPGLSATNFMRLTFMICDPARPRPHIPAVDRRLRWRDDRRRLTPRQTPDMTARIRTGWQLVLLALVAMPLAAVAGVGIDHVTLRSFLTPAIPIALVLAATQTWGLDRRRRHTVPAARPANSLRVEGQLQPTVLTTVIAVIYWDTLGRPTMSPLALWAAAVFAVFASMLTWTNGLDLQQAAWVAIVPFSGVTFGTCLAANETARHALGFGCTPLAPQALAEIAGFNNDCRTWCTQPAS